MCVLTRITIIIFYTNYNSQSYSLLMASSTATRALRRRACMGPLHHSTQRRAHIWTSKIKSLCACMSSSAGSLPHLSRRDCPAHLVHDSSSSVAMSHHAKDSQYQDIRWRFRPFLSLQHAIIS